MVVMDLLITKYSVFGLLLVFTMILDKMKHWPKPEGQWRREVVEKPLDIRSL